jgi:fimbrial chaperone protein
VWLCALASTIVTLGATFNGAQATSLRVAPALLDVPAPGATTTLTLRNDGDHPIHVQIRVFGWTGTQGEPVLVPTDNVVASPPAATLNPGTEYVVRIVRLAKEPVSAEESYRLLVDELPDATQDHSNTVRFALRYSIPVFFYAAKAPPANVEWGVRTAGNALTLSAANAGARRMRVANLKITDSSGVVVLQRQGLAGYVLGKTSTRWSFANAAQIARRGPFKVVAETESGSINDAVNAQLSR